MIATMSTMADGSEYVTSQQLSSFLKPLAKGVVAWVRGYTNSSCTGSGAEEQCFMTECDVVQGRIYECALMNVTPDIANTKAAEFAIRYVTGTASYPNNSSPQMGISLRLSQFELGSVRCYYLATSNTRLRIRASIRTLDGQLVRIWCPGDGGILSITDLGVPPPQRGTIGPGPPGTTLKEWTITANSSKTYYGDGRWRTEPAYLNTLIMGDWQNGHGNQRAWFTFSQSDVSAYLDDLIGVPASNVLIAELRLSVAQWRQASNDGCISLGFHNTAGSLPGSTEPGGGIPNVHRPNATGTGPKWYGLFGGSVPNNFLDSMRDGYLNGFMVGNTFSGAQYCGVLEGFGMTNLPQLHMKYYK
jgi:hypothetical protein